MKYEDLLIEASNNNIYVIENANFDSKATGLINGDVIGLNQSIKTSDEKACVLAEELGHYYTSVGNILDDKTVENRKQEQRARLWAYNKQVGLRGIIDCHNAHCHTIHEMSEFLEVTEQFLTEALECYKHKYGVYTTVDNYIVGFEPYLYVIEKFQ